MLKKIIKWTLITILTLILGLTAAVIIFKDRIVDQVIVEVNNYLNVPIEVNKVDIEFFHGFPNVSVGFYEVLIAPEGKTIIQAEKLYALINPIQLIQGDMDIAIVEILNATINVLIDKDNKNNFNNLFKTSETESAVAGDTVQGSFNLRALVLKNITLNYKSDYSGSSSVYQIDRLRGNLNLEQGVYASHITSKLDVLEFSTKTWSSAFKRSFDLDFELTYNVLEKEIKFKEAHLRHRGATAAITGNINFLNVPDINLEIDGDQVTFELIASFLPRSYQQILTKYKASGLVDFASRIKGEVTPDKLPAIEAKLSLKDLDLTEEGYNANINKLTFEADLSIPDLSNLSKAKLNINKATGYLQDRPFEVNFSMTNLLKPRFSTKIKASATTSWILAAVQFPGYESAEGDVDFDIELDNKQVSEGLYNMKGGLKMNEIRFQWSDTLSIDRINGIMNFSNNRISLANLNLRWLNSDIIINGAVQEAENASSQDRTTLLLRSDVRSNRMDIEDIVALIQNAPSVETNDSSQIDIPLVELELVGSFKKLNFQRYHGSNVVGEILYQDNILEVVDLNGKGIGGAMKLNGKLKVLNNRDIFIEARALTKGVYLDSLFYVFHNFTQDFITEENLKGKIYAEINTSMFFDSTWRFRRQLLKADAKVGVVEGQLNNFEPLMALSSYIDDKEDGLSRLQFSDLVNNVKIWNDTIFIPEMSIKTNVRNIALGGYHTLDQHINYQLAVPIINERVDKDEAFGAVQKSSKGSPNLLFRIKGTTSDYKVNYDLLRATGNVLKLLDITKIFKKKEEEPVDSSFLNDEEFDWNN